MTAEDPDLLDQDDADEAAADPEPTPTAAEYLLRAAATLVVVVAAAGFAVVEAFLVPFTIGGGYVPVSAILAVTVNLSLPRLTLWLTGLRSLALLPGLVWFIVVILGTIPTAEGDLVLHDAWPSTALLLAGAASIAASGYRIVTGPLRPATKS